MGLFDKLKTLIGYVEKDNQVEEPPKSTGELIAETIYPKKDHLSSSERKTASERKLQDMGIPILPTLPLTEDAATAKFRNPQDIARRAIILMAIINAAHDVQPSEEVIAYLGRYDLWYDVSPSERTYLQKQPKSELDNMSVSWRIESLNVLLWSLGLFDKLPWPTRKCDLDNFNVLPSSESDPDEWITQVKLRNTEDILDEHDLTYRLHSILKSSTPGTPSIPVNQDIITERHHALTWLTTPTTPWDDITTETRSHTMLEG